jgi:copper resistance protein D
MLNAADFMAWFGVCGLVLARAGLMPPAAFAIARVREAWSRGLLTCLALLAATGSALLIVRTMEMGGLAFTQVPGVLPAMLLQTHFGKVWALHLALLIALAAGVALGPRFRVTFGAAVFMAACVMLPLALTYSATSHAGDQGDFTRYELNDWAHVVVCSVWGGGILVTLFFAFPMLRGRRDLLAESILRLSALSAVMLPGVLLTAAYNAALRVPDVQSLAATAYGRTIVIKVVLVGLMGLVGAYGRFVAIPAFKRAAANGDASRQIARIGLALGVDVVLLAGVLIAASMLIQGMPPSSTHGMAQGMEPTQAGRGM